jgi:Ca-activated chloride channel family protein
MRSLRSAQILFLSTFLFSFLLVFSTIAVAAQSGRKKEPGKEPSKSRPGPIADPSRPASGTTPAVRPSTDPKRTTGEEVDESDVVRVTSILVPIPASVIDSKGLAITGLKLEDFELLVDGQVRPLSDLTRSETPVRLAMLFDNSGSLDVAREFEKRAAVHFFRRVMRTKDEAAVFSIESDSYLAQPLTNDVARLEQTILGFGRPEGSTSLFDAVIDAAEYLRPYGGRRVLVIVSDGIETTSRADFATTMHHVLADDCQVFVVQTGLYEGANLRALAAERRMEELAGQTGGAVFIPKSTSDLEYAFDQIAADLAQQYVLSYYPGEQQRDGRFYRLELKVKTRKDIRVRSRKGYYSRKSLTAAATGW